MYKRQLQGTNITCYSFRHYYALRCHLKLIDFGSASLSIGHSIEAHHRNYPHSKESTTTNAFKNCKREDFSMKIYKCTESQPHWFVTDRKPIKCVNCSKKVNEVN